MIAAILLTLCLMVETLFDLCLFVAVILGGTVLLGSWILLAIDLIVPGGANAVAAHAYRCFSTRPGRLCMGNAIARGWARF